MALRRFARADGGVIAIEFVFIAPAMLIMTFGLVEILISFLISTTLESATAAAAREIRTGVFQSDMQGKSEAESIGTFKQNVCAGVAWLSGDCEGRLSVASRTFASFPAMQAALPTLDESNACWQPGAAGNIVLVTVSYRWRVITPLLRPMLGETPDGYQTMRSMAVFQNEPFLNSQPLPPPCA